MLWFYYYDCSVFFYLVISTEISPEYVVIGYAEIMKIFKNVAFESKNISAIQMYNNSIKLIKNSFLSALIKFLFLLVMHELWGTILGNEHRLQWTKERFKLYGKIFWQGSH